MKLKISKKSKFSGSSQSYYNFLEEEVGNISTIVSRINSILSNEALFVTLARFFLKIFPLEIHHVAPQLSTPLKMPIRSEAFKKKRKERKHMLAVAPFEK